ncbi:bifunctional DNA primase/polymerase [Bradyrhizobium jicamae]|uniref:bifunctional DNA primase/polymerase n=1 Tax=Bradyrhizobium jicamae TaxID=280332 RepID=UPI0009F840BF|nr:bifunctional DNA primase/polymerase [Bradyrhizobium jicamae]
MSDSSAFERAALAMYGNGYSLLPIVPHNAPFEGRGKAPGTDCPMAGWQDYCTERASIHKTAAWGRRADRCGGGLGLACGFGGVVVVDIDFEPAMDALLAMLPQSNVQKKGRKGISLFYRGNTDAIRSRNFRTPERIGLVDLLSEGKQTVLPPSIHPDTGEPYYWWTDDTLLDVSIDQLTELPDDIAERIGEALKAYGYDPQADRRYKPHGEHVALAGGSDGASLFREANNAALANFHAWVPYLGLQRCCRAGGGFKAVAEWRASGSGRALHLRALNLSFKADGIRDFGDGRGYTPIDVVMEARRVSASEALDWLAPRVGVTLGDPEASALADRVIANSIRKKKGA